MTVHDWIDDGLLQDVLVRYGMADLMAEGRVPETGGDEEPPDLFAIASERIDGLLADLRAFIPPRDYGRGETGHADRVPEPTGEPERQVVEHGYHVRVHVLNTDLNGYYGLLKALPLQRGRQDLLQRHYAHMSKLSVGTAEAKNVKTSGLRCALALVAMLTPNKAARVVGTDTRVALFPDLPLEALAQYIRVFRAMRPAGPGLAWTMTTKAPRLQERDGNFPEAPPAWAFSNLGLTAALAAWAKEAGYEAESRPVIRDLARNRMYVLGESGDLPESLGAVPHVAEIAADLPALFQSSWKVVAGWHENEQNAWYRSLKHWLLYYDTAAWRSFLRTRAQYPDAFTPIIDHFLMQRYDPELIDSVKAVGRHINAQCYHAADGKTAEKKRENKAKNLNAMESLIQDGKSPADFVGRVSTQVGRMTGTDLPADADVFFDAVINETVDLPDAKNMLMAYMRIRSASRASGAQSDASPPTDTPPADTDDAAPEHDRTASESDVVQPDLGF